MADASQRIEEAIQDAVRACQAALPEFIRYALGLGLSVHDAHDAVQDVLLAWLDLCRRRPGHEFVTDPSVRIPLLKRSVQNALKNERKRRLALPLDEEMSSPSSVAPIDAEREALARIDFHDVAMAARTLLNPTERLILARTLEGHTDSEIAREAHIKPGSVRVFRHRLRQKLKGR